MGLLNKLKNALFEEEEIDIEPNMDKVVIKDEEIEEPPRIEEELQGENERDLFKAENTFKFPDFDEEEFAINYQPPKVKEIKKKSIEEEKPKINLEQSKKTKIKESRVSRREKTKLEEPEPVKVFHPSPIISPVYGILDKNYKKEDLIKASKPEIPKKIDVDMVRKKAFGTLEDDIEKTLNESVKSFYDKKENEEEKDIVNDLLNKSIDDEVIITDSNDYTEELNLPKLQNNTDEIEKELDREVEEEKVDSNKEFVEENTLENDLFDLIDSMYDNKEDE